MTIAKMLMGLILGFHVYGLFRLVLLDDRAKKLGMKVPWQSHAAKVASVFGIGVVLLVIARLQ